MTNPNSIQSVPLDYFMDPVTDAQQQEQEAPEVNAQAPQQGAAPDHPPRACELIRQLDVLLMKAAQASTKSLDGKTVKTSLQKLVDDGALSKSSLKLLSQTADKAQAALNALNRFSGKDLAAAFSPDGTIDASSKAGKAVRDAIDSQNELSDLLAQLDRQLDSIARHADQMRQSNRKFKGVDAALQNEITEMRQLCDRRATEINRLAYQMRDFAVQEAVDGQNADPNITAILNAKVQELLPRQALAMHGTAGSLAALNEQVTARLRPLAERIESFRADPKATLDSEKLIALQSDINTMKAALRDIRKNGIEVPGGRVMVARDFIEGLEKELGEVEARFSTARRDVARLVYRNFLATAKTLLSYKVDQEQFDSRMSETNRIFFTYRTAFFRSMRAAMEQALDEKAPKEVLQARLTSLDMAARGMAEAAGCVLEQNADDVTPRLKEIVRRARNFFPAVANLISIMRALRGSDRLLTGAEARSLFEGKLSVSSVIESRARGLDEADVDLANEDSNIVSAKPFGGGSAGKVYLLKRADGKSVIFKGETESRTGLAGISAGSGKAYHITQQTVDLNIASRKAAEALGMGDMIVKYSAGTRKGVFGFFMDKAKGRTANAHRKTGVEQTPEDGLTADDIRALPLEDRRKIKADLMRELNRLQWLDLVTGQMDRHSSNYFIHIDSVTHKVTVTGIDNDAGYSTMRTGAVTVELDQNRTSSLLRQLDKITGTSGAENGANTQTYPILSDPGVTIREDGCVTVDGSKVRDPALAYALKPAIGIQSLVVPEKIDRATYDALMALKQGPRREAYLDSIRPRLSQEAYDAAVSRLDDVIAQAERLGRENRIIEDEPNGWLEEQDAPLANSPIYARKPGGQQVKLGGLVSHKGNTALCPSYFTRDGLDKLFWEFGRKAP